ncbi:uncharacterized protein LOC117337715 [Pecten maximus]|uniref:uncharacterized protein LOC117337715 n=1 Tax=Pecten maximus TaxID=6579 RepID=UPI001457EAAE|nr:uncharacterized protein LOC117337715 [Pecten maximus]
MPPQTLAFQSNFGFSSAINQGIQNTFTLDGVSDVNRWAFMPVRVVYRRPEGLTFDGRNVRQGQIQDGFDMYNPTIYNQMKKYMHRGTPATYPKCPKYKSGAGKIFIETNGINYAGTYKDFAMIDARQPVTESYTYVGFRNPSLGPSRTFVHAYDSYGRVCQPRCMVRHSNPPRYVPCSGAITANTRTPRMYGNTFGEAVLGRWDFKSEYCPQSFNGEVFMTFYCDYANGWPWRDCNKNIKTPLIVRTDKPSFLTKVIAKGVCLLGFTVVVSLIACCHAFVEPISMPENLQECYKFRTGNISITDVPSQDINMFCITQFLYSTKDLRPQRPIANETLLYAQELLRQLVHKHQHHRRSKRQSNPMVRREIRVLSRAEWNAFTTRLNELKRRPVGDIFGYDALADIHRLVVDTAHNGPNFLGLHRVYLALLEIALGMPIPYWDSSFDFYMEEPTDSVIWTPEFFGNGFGALDEGPFQWMTPEGVPLIRNIGNAGTLISWDAIAAVLSRRFNGEIVEPSQNPVFSLEAHHNGPHLWMDGQMSALATSAQDPVFFMHHAFIDYIWSIFRSQQRANGIDPSLDYPQTNAPGQQPSDPMIPFGLRNIDGYSNFFESLNVYEPSPSCPYCGGSQYLECVGDRCRSRVALRSSGAAGFASGVPSSFGGPVRSQATVQRTGPLPIGRRFTSFFTDPRIRGDTMPNAPSNRMRRSVLSSNNTRATKNIKDSTQINRPYQNTFVLNGVSNVDLWAFVPVRIIFERPPEVQFESYLIQNGTLVKSSDMFSPVEFKGLKVEIKRKMPATYKKCHVSGSGASKVYVQTDGIDYSGRYKDYAVVDERLPVSSSLTYVGVKNPTEGAAQFYMTAYDSCGRVCTPQCLINGIYQPCSGAFRITSSFPKMYGITFEDAVKGIWKKGKGLLSEANAAEIPVAFLCEIHSTWPWSFGIENLS